MLNRVFARGQGVATGIDYGLSPVDHKGIHRSVAPRIIFGDPEWVKTVVNSMSCRQRYTAGVLAFAERSISRKVKRQIINEHLQVMFPGLDRRRIACVYVEHHDKGICEIHYWLANLDLETGKRLNGYFHRADCTRTRLWVQSINDRYMLEDPNDPSHWRLSVPSKRDRKSEQRETMRKGVVDSLQKMAVVGLVKSRSDIETALIRAGWLVSRRTKNFISISHDRIKYSIRLAGRMFGADWKGAPDGPALAQLARRFQLERSERLRSVAAKLTELLEARSAYNRKRFSGREDRRAGLIELLRNVASQPPEAPIQAETRSLLAEVEALKSRYGLGLPSQVIVPRRNKKPAPVTSLQKLPALRLTP